MVGLQNGFVLSVTAYPVPWRFEVVNDDLVHRGFEYVQCIRKMPDNCF